jgi:hypothetical protein
MFSSAGCSPWAGRRLLLYLESPENRNRAVFLNFTIFVYVATKNLEPDKVDVIFVI